MKANKDKGYNWGKHFREERISATGNDSRYTTKVVADRRKKSSNRECRTYKFSKDEF